MSKRPHLQSQDSITEDAYCGTHLEPLELFCDDDQITLCSQCLWSQEHEHHKVQGMQEAAENYRYLFQEMSNTLREKLEVAKSILADEQERKAMVQEEKKTFKEMIQSEYKIRLQLLKEENELNFLRLQGCKFDMDVKEAHQNQLLQLGRELKKKSQNMLQRLSRLEMRNLRRLQESEARASEHLRRLQEAAAELRERCGHSALALLQNPRSHLKRSEAALLYYIAPARILDLSACHIRGMSRMLTVLQRQITLDPETAHPCLALSEDLKSVKIRNVSQDVPGNPRRFEFGATVLGTECFTSGRHYWEVVVEKATQWQLGICYDSANGKGGVSEASGDKILLMGSMMGPDYTFWIFPPLKKVCSEKQMQKVGIFLDYESGHISFYNVMESSLVYNFSGLTFRGALRPVFSLCIPHGEVDSDILSLCSPPGSSWSGAVGS
ncbi:putative E3 ubiquitin-protein ligase TRIML2 [Ctenodactylus gundi]